MRQHYSKLGLTISFLITFGISTSVSPSIAQPVPAPVFSGRFDPARGRVVSATTDPKGYVLWTFASVVPGTEYHEVQTFDVRYFVQRIDGSNTPEEVFSNRGRGGEERNGTILADGSVLISTWNHVVWARAGQPSQEQPWPQINKYDVGPVAIYPDGMVGEEYRPGETGARAWWIPIDGHSLKVSARVELDKDVPSISRFIRSGQRVAWLNAPQITENTPRQQRKRPTFCVFDIPTGKVDRIPVDVRDDCSLDGFDGKQAVGGGMLIDSETGKTTPLHIPGDAVGIDGNTIYAIQYAQQADRMRSHGSADIVSVALDGAADLHILAHIDRIDLAWENPRDHLLLTSDGPRVWDGRQWTLVK